jgi:hypothetical protein
MKRLLIVLGILLFVIAGLSAQITDYDDFAAYFQTFADEVANSLPITASVGGNWSPAHIGQFPHFGVGVSLGGMFLPYEAVEPVVDGLQVASSIPAALKTYGIPFPAIAVDARLGGFIIPFDMGVKFGYIPEEAKTLFSDNVTADYVLAGFDARLRLTEGSGLLPTISAGAGYNYMQGTIGINDVSSAETIDITIPMEAVLGPGAVVYELEIANPDLAFNWDTHTISSKVQASWDLSLLTPHLGIGAAYGISNAGGGLYSQVVYEKDDVAQPDLSEVESVFDQLGYPIPTVDGVFIDSDANGWSFWVYGGTALNIVFITLDLSAMYNFLSGTYGASANVRIQL